MPDQIPIQTLISTTLLAFIFGVGAGVLVCILQETRKNKVHYTPGVEQLRKLTGLTEDELDDRFSKRRVM